MQNIKLPTILIWYACVYILRVHLWLLESHSRWSLVRPFGISNEDDPKCIVSQIYDLMDATIKCQWYSLISMMEMTKYSAFSANDTTVIVHFGTTSLISVWKRPLAVNIVVILNVICATFDLLMTNHQRDLVASLWGQLHKKRPWCTFWKWISR